MVSYHPGYSYTRLRPCAMRMGMISFILCDIAREAGGTVATGTPVARIVPEEGAELVGGDRIPAPIVVSNADPQVTLRLLGEAVDANWKAQVERVPIKGCTAAMPRWIFWLSDI